MREANPHCYTTPPIRLGPDSVVIDVGACEGLFAFRVLRQKLAREVIAFEPFPAMAELLRRGAVANAITSGTKGFMLVNGRMALRHIKIAGADAELAVWGKNLSDRKDPTFALTLGGIASSLNFLAPRTFGVDLGIEF